MNFLTNLRCTSRQITKQPGFFALAVAALALGIGANTAIFSAVEAVLLRPLPYSQPDRLVVVWEDASNVGFAFNTPAPANYLDWQTRNHVFTDMLAIRFDTASLTGDGQPEQLSGKKVTTNFFDVLGVQPVMGRPFTAEEDKSQTPVVVYAVAQRTREIGVRMVLGANPTDVTQMILGRGMKLSAMGLLAGGALAAGLAALLRTLLFGVTLMAPGIYAGTAAALVLVAMLACVIPAQRAARVDPAVALRNE
jgi:hypothetical protein